MENKARMLTAGAVFQLVSGCAYIAENGDESSPCTDLKVIEQRFLDDDYDQHKLSVISKTTADLGCNTVKQLFMMPFRAGAFLIECPLRKALNSVSSTENAEETKNHLPPFCDFLEQ